MQSETTFKDFEMISRLGEGSYSSVYKVKRISDNQIYAFKRVKMNQLNSKEKENALNEVRILASLTAPFIIGYKEAFFDESTDSLCIIMEYAECGDLQKLIKTSSEKKTLIPEIEIWRCLVHISQGLNTLHECNILHRDLKCANVFITNNNVYKLGDMNVSKVAAKGLVYTQTGTPYYASPEVWRDEAYDMKSDIWSLGCVLYEMASGKPPFTANDMQGLFKKVQRGIYERIPKAYSDDLKNVIGECLKVQASLRPNAAQLLRNPIVVKRMKNEGNLELATQNSKAQLLNTIEVPKNLKFLKERLPKPNYKQDKLNSSFEGKKSEENKKNIPQRGVSAGCARNEKNKFISKETIFKEEIPLKVDIKTIRKEDTPSNITKKIPENIIRPNSRQSSNRNLARQSSRNLAPSPVSKNIDILHSPLPEIQIKSQNVRTKVSPKAILTPKSIPLSNMKGINEILIGNQKENRNVKNEFNLNEYEQKLSEMISRKNNPSRPGSKGSIPIQKPKRPYSHVTLRKKEEIKPLQPEKIQNQIRINAQKPIVNRNIKGVRPLSGVDRKISIEKNQNNLPKKQPSKGVLEDAIDLLRAEIYQKQQKKQLEIGVAANNNNKAVGMKRSESGNSSKAAKRNSKNIEYNDYQNKNIVRNRQNTQERKPITAPANASRPHYKIKLKEPNNRVILGQQIVNNVGIKKKNNLF